MYSTQLRERLFSYMCRHTLQMPAALQGQKGQGEAGSQELLPNGNKLHT